jgi:RHS repeat-associated protein
VEDGRGTVRMLTNSAGTVTDAYEYDAFGNLIAQTGSTPNAYLYRGERFDSDLGLYYLRARWYNPATGRFMTRDPYQGNIWDPASLHRYSYARANPVNHSFPRAPLPLGRSPKSALLTQRFPQGKLKKIHFRKVERLVASVHSVS